MKKAAKKTAKFASKAAPSSKIIFTKKAAKKAPQLPAVPQTKEEPIEVKAAVETLQGHYANLVQIRSRKDEFIIDFCLREGGQGVLTSRIILTPHSAKRLNEALQKNVDMWEERYGDSPAE